MTLKLKPGTRMVHLCADNDENGNPQRGYMAMVDKGEPGRLYMMFWDEGYQGHHCVPEELREAAYQAVRQEVDVDFYELLMARPVVEHRV